MRKYVLGIFTTISFFILVGIAYRPFHWIWIPLDILSIAYLVILVIANDRKRGK